MFVFTYRYDDCEVVCSLPYKTFSECYLAAYSPAFRDCNVKIYRLFLIDTEDVSETSID